jgi:alanyl-tRNA synthetase
VVKLLGESSIGPGVRRVEALVGADAYRFLAREHVLVAQLSEALKARPEELPERVHDMIERLRAAEKALEQTRIAQLLSQGAQLAADAADIDGVRLISLRLDGADAGDIRTMALNLRSRVSQEQPGAAVLIGVKDGKVAVVAATNEPARERGVRADDLLASVMPLVGGRGGGKDDVAQGGGSDASRIDEALDAARAAVARAAGA